MTYILQYRFAASIGYFHGDMWHIYRYSSLPQFKIVMCLVRYLKLKVAHAPGMPRTFSQPKRVSDPDMHHGTCVTDLPWCMPGSLNSGFLWSRWRGKRFRHSRPMRYSQFNVSVKRPMVFCDIIFYLYYSVSLRLALLKHPTDGIQRDFGITRKMQFIIPIHNLWS